MDRPGGHYRDRSGACDSLHWKESDRIQKFPSFQKKSEDRKKLNTDGEGRVQIVHELLLLHQIYNLLYGKEDNAMKDNLFMKVMMIVVKGLFVMGIVAGMYFIFVK